ncbi:MAG: Maf family protein [Candidatus Kapaibacteriota bacterium]
MNIYELLKLNKKIILASKSPRREYLLKLLGLNFDVIPSHIDESQFILTSPSDFVETLSKEKAQFIANLHPDKIIIAADTIVWLENEVLSKPKSYDEAFKMLRKLSNNTHEVFTGITVLHKNTTKLISKVSRTEVTFRYLTDEEIDAYIKTGSPFDKAGAYGIQDDFGAVFVSNINGCYYNIVGLPLSLLYDILKEFQS